MAIDWSTLYRPGGQNLPGQQMDYTSAVQGYYGTGTGAGSVPMSYDEIYRQTRSGARIPTYNVSPFDVFDASGLQGINPLLAPDGTIDTSKSPYEGLPSMNEYIQNARTQYEANRLQQLDLARQGALRTGADQYSQARMAMEQQRALSDTRGLTAGAREGAEQQLSAAQQVALNQIEAGTFGRLDQLEQLRAQIPMESLQYAQQEWELFQATDRRVADSQSTDPEVKAKAVGSLLGYNDQEIQDLIDEYGGGEDIEGLGMAISSRIENQLSNLASNPNFGNLLMGWGMDALTGVGTATGAVTIGAAFAKGAIKKVLGTKIAGSALAFLGTSSPALAAGLSAAAPYVGVAILAAGIAYTVYRGIKSFNEYKAARQSPEQKLVMIKDLVDEGTKELKTNGFTDKQIKAFWETELAEDGYGPNIINQVLG